MESRKIVFHETAVVAIGVAVCTAVMIGVFALVGAYDTTVLLGGIAGAVLSVGNFFFMAVIASLAADKAQQQDVEGGKKLIKASYPIRILVLAVLLFALAKSGWFHVLALALPLVFVRPSITIAEFFRKKGE
ncbi:MAG: hypothetical protein IJB17_00465 [Oscillospiraceae bacterium]|nr:hypothetical protein [Oscillospiraceae bacterium]